MTCATCHNTHNNERNNVTLYSQTCMTCHTPGSENFCKMAPELGTSITTNCIDCHMPKKSSQVLSVYVPSTQKTIAAVIREHLIAVYPEETVKVSAMIKAATAH